MANTSNVPLLGEVLEEFFSASERPDLIQLQRLMTKYPQYQTELADFAIEWNRSVEVDDSSLLGEGLPVERLLQLQSKTLAELFQVRNGQSSVDTLSATEQALAEIRGRRALLAVGNVLGLGRETALLTKILDGLITNVPNSICARLANYLRSTPDLVRKAIFSQTRQGAYSYKSATKPAMDGRESWQSAVGRLAIESSEKDALLAMDTQESGE